MYRNIESKFWTDPWVRQQDPKVKLLYLYLITNPRSHSSGIYNLSLSDITRETGLSEKDVRWGIDTLSMGYRCRMDTVSETVYLPKMAKYQIRGTKALACFESHIKTLHPSPALFDFCRDQRIPYPYPIDGASYNNNNKEKEKDHENENTFCSEPSEAEAPEREKMFEIPTNKNGEMHPIHKEDIAEWTALYPAVDVEQEIRNVIGWCNANQSKRKTKAGMRRFLNSWLSRKQDKGHVVQMPVRPVCEVSAINPNSKWGF